MTTNESKDRQAHTPTPWQWTQPSSAAGWAVLQDIAGNEIGSGDGGFDPADAAYIVQCVNSCAALADALRHVVSIADDEPADLKARGTSRAAACAKFARAALAAYEAGQS